MAETKATSRRLMVILTLCAAIASGIANAEEGLEPWSPGALTEEPISALAALEMTLEHAPFIRLQEQDVALREGLVLQSSGQFDPTLLGNLSYQYSQTLLTAKERESEQDRRDETSERLDDAQTSAEGNQQTIAETSAAREVWFTGGDLGSVTFSDEQAQAEYDLLLRMYEIAEPDEQDVYEEAMIDFFDAVIADAQEGLAEDQEEILDLQDKLARMGDIPEVTQSFEANLNLALSKQFRNGIVITPSIDLSGSGVKYKEKPYEKDDGGLEIPDSYTTTLGFDVVIPLARDLGMKATGAAETAAKIDYEASLDSLAFSASTSALGTLAAYWDLAAAQERLVIRERSLEVNERILELTTSLIEADELPRAESARTEASVAQEQAAVDAARRAVIEARMQLADAMGLEVNAGAMAPLAGDPLPIVPGVAAVESLTTEALVATALGQRLDLQSARKLERSGKVLAEAARINLRPVVDLDLGISYNNLGENRDSGEALSDSLTGEWAGPSGNIGLTMEVPFGNNTQRGRLMQREAALASTRISVGDLERQIGLNIVLDTASMVEVARQYAAYARAVESYREAVSVELERLRYGTVTVLDTLVTQQRSLASELALIESQLRYARLLAQLNFDLGRLVVHDGGAGRVDADTLVALPGR
jgi:outer membrane protein TolC